MARGRGLAFWLALGWIGLITAAAPPGPGPTDP